MICNKLLLFYIFQRCESAIAGSPLRVSFLQRLMQVVLQNTPYPHLSLSAAYQENENKLSAEFARSIKLLYKDGLYNTMC